MNVTIVGPAESTLLANALIVNVLMVFMMTPFPAVGRLFVIRPFIFLVDAL
jgi:hypothetical protein